MPKQFTGQVETPMNLEFGADELHTQDDGWQRLEKAAPAMVETSHNLVLDHAKKQFEGQVDAEEEFYSESRRLKRGMWEASRTGDEEAVSNYAKQLESLKIAERQGAISGTNGQIRRDGLLRQYINRFPHLEEELRRGYSSTRERAQSEREQFKDPIEEGMNDAISKAQAMDMPLGEYLNLQRRAKRAEVESAELTLQATMGKNIENEVDAMFNDSILPMELNRANTLLARTVQEIETKGVDFNAEKIHGDLMNWKRHAAIEARRALYSMRDRSGQPDGVMSREFVDGVVKRVEEIYDEKAKLLDSFDTLKAYERARKIGTEQAISNLSNYDPLLGFMISIDPARAGEIVFKNWETNKNIYLNGGLSRYNVLLDQATKAGDTAKTLELRFQRDLLVRWYGDGKAVARDFENAYNGAPLESSGSREVDANRLNAVTNTIANLPSATPEQKAAAVKTFIESEKLWSGPGEYLAPSALLYMDPVKARILRESPQAKKDLTDTIENIVPQLLASMKDPAFAASLTFVTDLEAEQKTKNPWEAYKGGGPFTSTEVIKEMSGGSANRGMEPNQDRSSTIRALNRMYWLYRNMYGAAQAEDFANNIVGEAVAQFEPEEGEGAPGEDGTPQFEVDLTD